MLVNFSQVLRNLKGLPLTMGEETVTLKFVAVTALLNTFPGEQVDGAQKAYRYQLAKAIETADQAELGPNAIELIKQLVGMTFGPPVVGPVFELLEAPTPTKEYIAPAESAPAPAAVEASPEEPRTVQIQMTGRRSGKTALRKAMRDRAEQGLDQLPKKGTA